MIIVRLSGGLGNQMFQYALGRALALQHKTDFKLDLSTYDTSRKERKYMLDAFDIKTGTASSWERLFKHKVKESNFTFSPEVMNIPSGLFLGNWQSEKYFAEFADQIRQDFKLKKPTGNLFADGTVPVSIHIRRGDYATDARTKSKHGVLPISYYEQAMKMLTDKVEGGGKKPHFYVFSDDIGWAKENLKPSSPTTPITYVSGNGLSEAAELIRMSMCDHHIIANSSYSWWGAWLNPKKDKVVIAPKEWFQTIADTKDLLPEGWLRI